MILSIRNLAKMQYRVSRSLTYTNTSLFYDERFQKSESNKRGVYRLFCKVGQIGNVGNYRFASMLPFIQEDICKGDIFKAMNPTVSVSE